MTRPMMVKLMVMVMPMLRLMAMSQRTLVKKLRPLRRRPQSKREKLRMSRRMMPLRRKMTARRLVKRKMKRKLPRRRSPKNRVMTVRLVSKLLRPLSSQQRQRSEYECWMRALLAK